LIGADRSPLTITHRDCGENVHLALRCAGGHELDSPRQAAPRPGPGDRRRVETPLEEFRVYSLSPTVMGDRMTRLDRVVPNHGARQTVTPWRAPCYVPRC